MQREREKNPDPGIQWVISGTSAIAQAHRRNGFFRLAMVAAMGVVWVLALFFWGQARLYPEETSAFIQESLG